MASEEKVADLQQQLQKMRLEQVGCPPCGELILGQHALSEAGPRRHILGNVCPANGIMDMAA